MRVSECYSLRTEQANLDFVDVDVEGDTPLFVDPQALQALGTPWGDRCIDLLRGYFATLLSWIGSPQTESLAYELLAQLHEPNETHLGLSRNRANGSALGEQLAADFWKALTQSEAAKSGLLRDLEDMALLVRGIGRDRISDVVTNIVREPLIEYTQDMCAQYGIAPLQKAQSGLLWDQGGRCWRSELVDLPMSHGRSLILVPKRIVRKDLTYNYHAYYHHSILPFLIEGTLMSGNESLVRVLRDGRRVVRRTELKKKYPVSKETALSVTLENPQLLENFREAVSDHPQPPLDDDEIERATNE